ncbi:MAG: hypothetical protein LBU14_01110 [Candidatus Peribacteria bacterium]|nr:hypothetical protein [Candidatus Peribacteria bacterium]
MTSYSHIGKVIVPGLNFSFLSLVFKLHSCSLQFIVSKPKSIKHVKSPSFPDNSHVNVFLKSKFALHSSLFLSQLKIQEFSLSIKYVGL